jgi:ribose transport system permease protein
MRSSKSSTAKALTSALSGRWVPVFILLEIVYFCFRSEGFANPNSLQILLFYGVQVFLVATAELFVIITGGIDLSVGYVLGFATVISIKLVAKMMAIGISPPAALLLATIATLAIGVVPGLVNGALVAYLKVPPFIATFSMLGVCHGISELIINGVSAVGLPKLASDIGLGYIFYIVPGSRSSFFVKPEVPRGTAVLQILPNIVIITFVVVALFAFVLARTKFGRHVYALGGNMDAAIRSGIPVKRRILGVYAISSFLASLAGIVYAFMYVSGKADAGAGLLLDAIAAVVIGGASMFGGSGTVWRTMLGALVIAVLDLGLRMSGIPTFDEFILVGVILIFAVVMDRYMQEAS